MNRRDFLRTTACRGVAAAAACAIPGTIARGAAQRENAGEAKKESFAFFAHCCLCPDGENARFVLADQAGPIRGPVGKVLAKAEQLGAPLLFFTCLGLLRTIPTMSVKDTVAKERAAAKTPDLAFVGLRASPADVKQALACRRICLERFACPTGDENVSRDASSVFHYNPHAVEIVKALGDRHWVLFGNGFQYCGVATAVGLLALRQRVTILNDALLPAAGKTAPFQKTVEYLTSLGAESASSDALLARTGK